jgi:hypothetical protein
MKWLLLLLVVSPAQAASIVPNFTTGTVTSETTSRTEVIEVIKQSEYSTSNSYTVTGTNINIPSNPGLGANYTMTTQGAPFQFSETTFQPGLVTYTEIDRTTVTDSVTLSTSVFTQ